MYGSQTNGGVPVPERCDCRPGDVVGYKYRVDKELGQGSFGVEAASSLGCAFNNQASSRAAF